VKKIIIIILFVLFIFTGCEKDENPQINQNDAGVEVTEIQGMTVIDKVGMTNVFAAADIDLGFKYNFDWGYHDKVFVMDERIYITAKKSVDRADIEELFIFSYDINGENEESFIVPPADDTGAVKFAWYDSKYNIVFIEEVDYSYTLYKRNDSNELVWKVPISGTNTIVSMAIGDDDNIYFGTNDKITAYDKNGKQICGLPLDNKLHYIASAHGKTPILKMYDGKNNSVYKYINAETKSLADIEMRVPSDYKYSYNNIIYGDGYDYYYYDINGVYGYDIAANSLTKVLDWLNSDIINTEVVTFGVISSEKMMMISNQVYNNKFSILNKVPDDKIPEKEYISIGCVNRYNDRYLGQLITNFNKNNTKYRATLTNYYSSNNGNDYTLSLNNAIAAGDGPDLLYVNETIPMLSYTSKGMFVDLFNYLNDEPELVDDLLPFVTEQTHINGILPQLVTNIRIQTMIGKTKNIGGEASLSMTRLLEMYDSLPKDTVICNDFNKDYLGSFVISFAIHECIDYETGTFDFDKPEIRSFIQLMKSLPEANAGNSFSLNDEFDKSRNDKLLLSGGKISSIYDYICSKVYPGRDEAATLIGYPTLSGDKRGDAIYSYGFSILQTSDKKDASWEFIKYSASEKFMQEVVQQDGIVPSNTGIYYNNKLFDKASVYIDDNLDNLAPVLFTGSGEQYTTGIAVPINEEIINEFREYLNSIDNYVYINSDIDNVVNEELSTYYNSDKSIDETMKVIHNRVSIYLNEIWG